MSALLAGKVFGIMSLAAVGLASTALVVGVMVFTGAAGLHGLPGLSGSNGANGANGAAGANGNNGATGGTGATGATGAPGENGTNGTGATWGSLALSFTLGGATTDIAIEGATCPSEGHGAYACLLTVENSGATTTKVTGLSYAQSPAVYYAGADPTIGSIILNPDSTTQFTLWFQAVQYSGSADVSVTVFIEPGDTSSP